MSNLDNLSTPCQLELIWFQSPDVQYLIVTRFEDRKDSEVIVHGPFPTYDAFDHLEQILQLPRWVEFLRDRYAKSGFSTCPKGQVDRSKIMEAIGSVIDKALLPTTDPGVYPHRTNVVQKPQARLVLETLRDAVMGELANA